MIKINLLPFRAARRQENIRRQISVYALSVLFCLVVTGYFFLKLNGDIKNLEAEKTAKKKELITYAETTKKIKVLKNKIKEIRAKLEVIRGLEKNKTGPVRLLDEIATAVPKDKLWLSSLSEKQGILTLKGTAKDNDTVALFMTTLEKAEQLSSVSLGSTKLRRLQEHKMNVTDFELSCKTYAYKEKDKPTSKKSRKRPAFKKKK